MEQNFEMVAKTMKGLEGVLAEELRQLGAHNVETGIRMVSFEGDLEMLYKANLCCRTALRILKPFYSFTASDADTLYDRVKEFDWSAILSVDKTFCLDTVVNSDDFTHSRFVTYKVKDAIVDWFRDRYGDNQRPGVRLKDADIMINVHISGDKVTLSLDSSGESLHKRGYRVAQTEAPINEVLAAGIILLSGWKGDVPFVDPMCGSGTFLIEAALIAANINPGIYRKSFAFENWPDFDADLFERLYNDDSNEREVTTKICGSDISPKAIDIAIENIKSAGVAQYIDVSVKPLSQWETAPKPAGVLITNPPYGERISAPDMEGLYAMLGSKLKNVFVGYHAWIIGYREDYFFKIGLSPSQKIDILNGSLECQLREYILFEGNKKSFLASGGKLKPQIDDDDSDNDGIDMRHHRRSRDEDPMRHRKDSQGPKVRRFKDDDDRRSHRDDDRKKRRFEDDDRRSHRDDDRKKRRFEDDDRGRRRDDDRGRRRYDDERRSHRDDDRGRRRYDDGAQDKEAPENPLAIRRNVGLLKALEGKMPSLPPSEDAPKMRSRGWRKKGE